MTELDTLWTILGGSCGFHLFRFIEDGYPSARWIPVEKRSTFLRMARTLGYEFDLRIGAVPVEDRGDYRFHMPASVLWAHVESGDALRRLENFKPLPTLLLKYGSSVRCTALWGLLRPLELDWVERANRRLAHHLAGPKKWVGPDFELHPPESIDRSNCRPVPIVASNGGGLYTPRQVVGHLREAPDPLAWKKRNLP